MTRVFIAALILATFNTSAQEFQSFTMKSDQNTVAPYLIRYYDCDWSSAVDKPDGSIERKLKNEEYKFQVLYAHPVAIDGILERAAKNWLHYLETDKDYLHVMSKVRDFENSGNIAAMRHWQAKGEQLLAEKQSYFKYNEMYAYVKKLAPTIYHDVARPDRLPPTYRSFTELKANEYEACTLRKPHK